MSIDFISEEIEKIEADSLFLKRDIAELANTYKSLVNLKEELFSNTFIGMEIEVLEDLRFKILENMALYKIYIREAKGLNINLQVENLKRMYKEGEKQKC